MIFFFFNAVCQEKSRREGFGMARKSLGKATIILIAKSNTATSFVTIEILIKYWQDESIIES